MVTITTVQSEADVLAILALQQASLPRNISIEEKMSEGFVTVEHRPDVLWKMNQAAPSIIAKNEAAELIGYTLTMLPEFAPGVPELASLFSLITQVEYKGKRVQDYAHYVMGQACVDKRYRGQRLLGQMLSMHREKYSHQYQLLISYISSKNNRSVRGHMAVGFEIIHSIYDPVMNETWHMLVWDWQK